MIDTLKSGLVTLINKFIPENEHQILFDSVPDFSDNSKAFFEYIKMEHSSSDLKLVWMVEDTSLLDKFSINRIQTYNKHSLMGFYQFFRSKYIVTTHNTFLEFKSSRQILINLWHGMPLKSMGYAEDSENPYLTSFRSQDDNYVLISTSNLMKNIMSSCFYIDARKVHITGQPRNDKIFRKEKSRDNLSKLLNKDITKYKSIILFTPTFRKWGDKIDGKSNPDVMGFNDYDDERFAEFIEENKILYLVKLHPFEESQYSKVLDDKDDVVLITSKMLQDNFLDIYDIMGASDILITDYSSIYFDFLLLEKPIVFIPTDLEEYTRCRGFVFEPYDFWAPGPKALEFADFITELNHCIQNPNYYEKERKLVNDIVNKHQDDKSSERVYNLVFGGKR